MISKQISPLPVIAFLCWPPLLYRSSRAPYIFSIPLSTYCRSQQIKKLKAAKAELKRSRRSKPYFDFLGDCRKQKHFPTV
jgi:hypothetical protein